MMKENGTEEKREEGMVIRRKSGRKKGRKGSRERKVK